MPTRLRYGGRQSRRRTLSGLYLPVPGKLRFPFRSFLSPFGFRFFTAPPYAFQNSSIPTRLRCGGRQIKTPYPARSSSSRFRASRVSPSALFSHLSVSAFLLHHRMRFKTLQYCPSSVAAADKSRRRTLSGFCLPGPRQTSFPLPLFSRLSVSAFLLHHRMRFKTLQYCPSSVAAADKSRRRTLSGFCLPGPRQTSFPLPLFSRLSVSAFLLHHRMRFKTLQYCPSSVAAADKSRRLTLSGVCLPVPGT